MIDRRAVIKAISFAFEVTSITIHVIIVAIEEATTNAVTVIIIIELEVVDTAIVVKTSHYSSVPLWFVNVPKALISSYLLSIKKT